MKKGEQLGKKSVKRKKSVVEMFEFCRQIKINNLCLFAAF